MKTCGICKQEIKGLVWRSAHTGWDYCSKCMFITHFDPTSGINPFGQPRQKPAPRDDAAKPHYYGDNNHSS